jgi:hypothetical protein
MKYLTIPTIFVIAVIVCIASVSALSVDGSKYTGNISPGSSDVHHFSVGTHIGDSPVSVTITASAFGQGRDMSYTMLSYDNKYSSSSFIKIDKPSFVIEPGNKVSVDATITMPSGAISGGRYAIIYVKATPVINGTSNASSYATAVTIPVMVTIDKSQLIESSDILGISVSGNVVSTRIKNTGNIHFYGLNDDVKIFDKSNGTYVTGLRSKPSVYAFLPDSEAVINTTFDRTINPKKYSVDVTVYKDDKQLAEQVMKDEPSPSSSTTSTPMSMIVVMGSVLAIFAIAFRYRRD